MSVCLFLLLVCLFVCFVCRCLFVCLFVCVLARLLLCFSFTKSVEQKAQAIHGQVSHTYSHEWPLNNSHGISESCMDPSNRISASRNRAFRRYLRMCAYFLSEELPPEPEAAEVPEVPVAFLLEAAACFLT